MVLTLLFRADPETAIEADAEAGDQGQRGFLILFFLGQTQRLLQRLMQRLEIRLREGSLLFYWDPLTTSKNQNLSLILFQKYYNTLKHNMNY